MIQIPVFLYQVFQIMFASVIPLLLILWLTTFVIKQLKKVYRSIVS